MLQTCFTWTGFSRVCNVVIIFLSLENQPIWAWVIESLVKWFKMIDQRKAKQEIF